ncbi:MAG: hypothetical protein KGV50_01810 [Gammaproteobacteria bacterium]|nr:hypothetical protein [Gammaproteobacteria bacterium]
MFVGAFPTIDNEKCYQTLLVFNSKGLIVDYYHKRHLFNVTFPNESYNESESFFAGSESKVIETPWGRVGLSICYDLRFPEHFRNLIDKCAELIMVPAAFTYSTGKFFCGHAQ